MWYLLLNKFAEELFGFGGEVVAILDLHVAGVVQHLDTLAILEDQTANKESDQ